MKKLILFTTINFTLLIVNSFAQNKIIDSLQTLLKSDKSDTNKVKHSNSLSWEYINIAVYDTALYYGNSALKLAQQLNFKKGIVKSLSNIGLVYSDQGDYSKALASFGNALKLDEELKNKKGISRHLGNMGIVFFNQSDYPKALDCYLKALRIAEEVDDKNFIAVLFINIGLVNWNQGDYPKALDYSFKALKLYEKLKNKNGIAIVLGNIGNVYKEQAASPLTPLTASYAGQIIRQELQSRALDYYFRALKMAEELGDKSRIAIWLGNIGDVYKEQGDSPLMSIQRKGEIYSKAFDYFFKALKMDNELGGKRAIAANLGNIGSLYTTTGKFIEAEQYLKKAIDLDDSIGAVNDQSHFEASLSQLYDTIAKMALSNGQFSKAAENYKLSMLYYKKAILLKDTVFSQENKKQLVRKEMNFEFERKEAITKTENDKEQAIADEKRKLILITLSSLLVFTISVFIFLYNRNKLKQKALMDQEMNRQHKLRFKAIIDAEEKERRRIAQDLHDGLGQLLSSTKLNISVLEDTQQDEKHIKNALSMIDSAIDEVRTISHNMMPGVLIRLGLISALRELTRKTSDSNKIKIDLKAEFDERLNEVNEIAVYRIIQESVNNMIKHSQASCISVSLEKNKEDLFIEIKDNGIGFDTSLIEKSTGIGWKNIYARTALLNGKIRVMSAPSKGTTIRFDFSNLFEQENVILSRNGKK